MAWTVTTLREGDANKSSAARGQSRFYNALADNDNENEQTAASATGLPVFGDPHPSDAVSFVSNIRATRDPDSIRLFKVEVQYSTRAQEEQQPDDPLSLPVEEEWSSYTDTELATGYFDVATNRYVAFTSSAGEAFEPIEVPVGRTTLIATRNEAAFNIVQANSFTGAVNSDSFQGFLPGEAKCISITGSRVSRPNSGFYWSIRYEIHFKPIIPKVWVKWNSYITDVSPWDLLVADQGFMYLVDDGEGGNQRVNITDAAGNAVSAAVPLDGEGHESILFDPDNPPDQVFRYFQINKRRAFSALGL